MALLTSTEAIAQIPELTGATEATKLDTLIAGLGAAFASFCGWPKASATASPTMESTSYTLYLTGDGGRDLLLPIYPVTAVASVYDDSSLDFTSSTYLVASGDYALVWHPSRGQILRLTSTSTHGSWSTEQGAIKLACTAGFTTVPEGLKRLAEMALRNWWDMRKTRGQANFSVSGGASKGQPQRASVDEWLPEHVKLGLAQSGFILPRTITGDL